LPPRSGLERSDFVRWRFSDTLGTLGSVGDTQQEQTFAVTPINE
jgi:hypothetical protein